MDPASGATSGGTQQPGQEASQLKAGKQSINYGALDSISALESSHMIPDVNLCPVQLFVRSWSTLGRVIGRLFMIVLLNFANPYELTMDCEDHHDFPVQVACALTLPGVRLFLRMGIILGLLLLAWRYSHERGYYVLMTNNIMVDFQTGRRFGCWTAYTLGALFLLGCLHLALKMFTGHSCNADFRTCNPKEYMFKNTMGELMFDPMIFYSQQNYQASRFLNIAVFKFLIPGGVSILSLAGFLDFENELMPLSKILEGHPCKAYRDLGKFVYVPEVTIRSIVRNEGVVIGQDGAEVEFSDVCRELYDRAVDGGCVVLGSVPELTHDSISLGEEVQEAAMHRSLFARVADLLAIDWWPMKICVEINLRGRRAALFSLLIGIHYFGTALAICVMMRYTLLRLVEYGGLVVLHFNKNYVMLFPELVLLVEFGCQVTWLVQVLKYVRYATHDVDNTVKTLRDWWSKEDPTEAEVHPSKTEKRPVVVLAN